MEVADRLWRDTSVFQERAQRTAAAYLAVVRALDDRRPPGIEAGELLALHRFVESLGPEVATAVFTDPYAVFWVRTAYGLVHSVLNESDLPADARPLARELGTDDARALLGFHLAQFKRLALGAAVAADAKLELAEPLEVALPTALPATRQALVGEGSLRLRGAADGRLIAADGGVFEQSPCPLVRVDDLEIPLQPYGYAFPGLGWQPLAVRSSLAYQQSQVDLVQRGLALVARHQPATFAQIRRFIRWIAVNPTWEVNPLIFVSTSELLGAFAVFAYQVPHVIAFAAVHELHHNRLFCLEELDAIHESGPLGTNDDARFYSPWRGDPRPPRGIFHAIYVTIPETRFWLEAFRAGDLDEETRLVAVDRLVRFPLLLALGIRQLERCKRFTARGEAYFRQLEEEVRRLREDVRAAGVPEDAPFAEYAIEGGSLLPPLLGPGGATLTSREMFVRHVRDFDRDRQIPDAWLDELLAD